MRAEKKIWRWVALASAGVLSGLTIITTSAQDPFLEQMFTLYRATPANNLAMAERNQAEQQQHIEKFQSRAYGELENFMTKAQLVFKADKWPMATDSRIFTLGPTATHESEWRKKGSLYVWHGDTDAFTAPLTIPIAPQKDINLFQLDEFDEFWLDYTSSPGVPQCTPQIMLKASILPYAGETKILQNFITHNRDVPYLLKPLVTIDATRANWKARERAYLMRRVLGMAPDEDWRYVQSQKYAVMQRRMHVPLDDADVLDISLLPGVKVERVNLMVGRDDDRRAGELVEFADVQKNFSLSEGRQGIRLNLREALEERFANEWVNNVKASDKHHFYLHEIFIFISGEANAIGKTKPIHRLVFLRSETGKKTQKSQFISREQTLASNVIGVNAYRQRMLVDLRKLVKKGNLDLKKAELRLAPPPGAASCAIRIEEAQAVRIYNDSVPVFARLAEDWSRRWGGIFNLTVSQKNQIESPGIVAYLPLAMLTHPDMKYFDVLAAKSEALVSNDSSSQSLSENGQEAKLNIVANLPSVASPMRNTNKAEPPQSVEDGLSDSLLQARESLLSYHMFGVDGRAVTSDRKRLISSNGASLGSVGNSKLPRVTVEGDLLVLEGEGQPLEISWPLSAHVNDKTWFYFGVDEGVEQIGGIAITLSLADGGVIRQQIVPNQPFRLIERDAIILNIKLRILPAVTPYRFKLREIALFAPSTVSYAQAFSVPLPTPYEVIPKPVLQATLVPVLEVQPGHVAGLAAGPVPNELLHFSTTLDPMLDSVRGLRLDYRLPSTYTDARACPLLLRLNWTNGKSERQICFEKLKGVLFIPITGWLETDDKLKNLGRLRSIDWTLRLSGQSNRDLPESFDLQFLVEGWTMLSAADHLRLSPLFYAGRHAFFADAERTKKIVIGNNLQKIWLPLEENALPRMLALKEKIQPVNHWLFTLDRVLTEPKRPISWENRQELIKLSVQHAPQRRWPEWLFWTSVALLTWATWKKGWWSVGRIWMLGRKGAKVFIRIWTLSVSGLLGRRSLLNINLAMGALALGLGLWLIRLLGLEFAGVMVFAASGLVIWGAYCHWREQRGERTSSMMMYVRLGFLFVTLGCVAWSLGKYALSAEALWGFLPLFGAMYVLLPTLYRLWQSLVRDYRGYVSLGGWCMLALIFYGMGLWVPVNSGENYFFIFGGLAIFFALRAWLLAIEPRLHGFSPGTAKHVYGGAGSLYFTGALVMLIMTAVFLSVGLEPIAEQLAIIVFYCLLIGTIKEAWALRIAH